MDTQDDDQPGATWPLLLGALLLAAALAAGLAIGRGGKDAAAPPYTPPTAVMPVKADDANGAADAPSVREDGGAVKFYFASASAELAPDAKEALGNVVKGVATGKTAVISGFDGDASDAAASNADLTARRVQAVRAALTELGIGDDKIVELAQPQEAASAAAAAQRVEVRLE